MPSKREEREEKKRKKLEEQQKCLTFIEEYRLQELLWNMTLPEYHDRVTCNQLTTESLEKYQEWHPNATKSDMMAKLNTLKTTYHTERKKVVQAEKLGTGTDNLYEPAWYCYSVLDAFMRNVSGAEPANPHCSSMSSSTKQTILDESLMNVDMVDESTQDGTTESDVGVITSQSGGVSSSEFSSTTSTRNKKRPKPNESESDQLMRIAVDRLAAICSKSKEPAPTSDEDKYTRLAKTWADDLRSVDPQQFIFAKKFINDILYKASLGNLHNDAVIFSTIVQTD